MKIMLQSKGLEITKLKRVTNAKMLKDLVVGDQIQLSVDASPVGGNRTTYAKYISVKVLRTGQERAYSFNQIGILYNNFEFKEIK